MRSICIHGHFYQPPREDPWTGRVPVQPTAAPYHDWNKRITAECYRPNLENYGLMSFNFGPTLLQWLERNEPDLHDAIGAADRAARKRFGGHGPALAQAWGHAILPLCNERDRRTQVLWGLKEFAYRFGRQAEGLWLPETAVDTETLETLSLNGVTFTILSPYQAEAVRPVGGTWRAVPDGSIDPRRAYRANLPSGRSIALFFYDGPLSAAVAFEKLPTDGSAFAARLKGAFTDDTRAQLVHVATDGETYGHHHAGGDRGLRETLAAFETDPDVRLTCYAEFLARYPPVDEVRIVERSSWSCPHQLGRWSRHCGCAADEAYDQHWRGPLREALRLLNDRSATTWEERVSRRLHDPWSARDDWIELTLDDSPDRCEDFLARHGRPGSRPEPALEELFEFQQRLIQTETSCAWFFEDLARIETVQVLRYAARAIELGERLFGLDLERPFLETLRRARSNDPDVGDGLSLWKRSVASTIPG